jgi:CRP-like cAMP-binding protein
MEPQEIGELFPLFSSANPETLDWLVEVVDERTFATGDLIVEEEDWGKEVGLIVTGWVKIQYEMGDRNLTVDVLSRGDYFGAVAIIDEALRSTEAIALSEVRLLTLSAQRFLQMLFKDPQLHHRMLQLSIKKNRQFYRRLQLLHQPPTLKLVKTLTYYAEEYGTVTERGAEIFKIPGQDLADISDISLDSCQQILLKLQSKNWLEIDGSTLILTNLKQLHHLAKQL